MTLYNKWMFLSTTYWCHSHQICNINQRGKSLHLLLKCSNDAINILHDCQLPFTHCPSTSNSEMVTSSHQFLVSLSLWLSSSTITELLKFWISINGLHSWHKLRQMGKLQEEHVSWNIIVSFTVLFHEKFSSLSNLSEILLFVTLALWQVWRSLLSNYKR